MEILFWVLGATVLVLAVKYGLLKRQVRSLFCQVQDSLCKNSEKMLDISLIDKDVERLAALLNQHRARQRQAVAAALRHEASLKESVANLSHDLRTPLTVMLGHMQLLCSTELSKEQSRRAELILDRTKKMKELVNAFYELALLDTEQIIPRKEQINLSNLVMNLVTENAPILESRGIFPEVCLPDCSVFLLSDRGMVERILQNLFANALRYSSGNIKISVCQTKKDQGIFCIENPVRDISKLDTQRLFERFYTGDSSRHEGGTGLGLAVVKALTEKLGGEVVAKMHEERLSIKVFFGERVGDDLKIF